MPNHGAGGRPKKPNSLHVFEGTARGDRGTDQLMVIPEDLAVEPVQYNFEEFSRDDTFTMMKDWVISATGAAHIDSILLTMMTDLLEDYALCKAEGDLKGKGVIIDRFHKLAREFGMTPSTRDTMVKTAVEENTMKSNLEGP